MYTFSQFTHTQFEDESNEKKTLISNECKLSLCSKHILTEKYTICAMN